MNATYERNLTVLPGVCDASGRLSYHDTFGVFMDIASIHAELLGVGIQNMFKRDLFWLTVKTKVDFLKRPRMGETVSVHTWLEMPERMRGNRSYEIARDGEILIVGKTEWAVMNTKTHALVPLESAYPDDMMFEKASACPEAFARVSNRFDDAERYGEYCVRSTDIDVGLHMNNTAYVRALIGSFSNAELKEMHIHKIDVIFRASCYEGDTLFFHKRRSGNGMEIIALKGEDTALLVRIE